ncbi:MAG TPA: dihydropteroate synthase [Chthoniobacteraceae bacterium]|nr:dihydropteroate synthase [Chthoniobacteraceae bacterium]
MNLLARRRTFTFPRRPLVMGIINLVEDSFSGDGLADPGAALARAQQMIADGADIIDAGGESAGTKRAAMSEQEEIDRLCPFIEKYLALENPPPLSINTWRPAVARAALATGGDILNDIGALPTDENARICAQHSAALLIMHSVGEPKIKHTHVHYDDVMQTLDTFFEEKIALAMSAGLPRDAIILDPGIDFAKQRDDNLRIYRELARLQKFERPILLPVSRKTVIGEVLNIADPSQRDAGTVACIVSGMLRGASIFRVHNVRAAVQAVRMVEAVEQVDVSS